MIINFIITMHESWHNYKCLDCLPTNIVKKNKIISSSLSPSLCVTDQKAMYGPKEDGDSKNILKFITADVRRYKPHT